MQETAFLWDGESFESARTRQIRQEHLERPKQVREFHRRNDPYLLLRDAFAALEVNVHELLGLTVVEHDVGASIAKHVYGPQQNPQQSHVSTTSPQQIGVRQNGLLEGNRLP